MTRLVLAFAGGGSLGAYTAGAAREILRALERGARDGGPPVAAVVGHSAGGVVAAVAARSLVRNPSLAPWLERMWVDGLDVRTLLDAERGDRSGLLDPGALDALTRAMVTADAASDDRPSAALGSELRVAIGLTGGPGGAALRGGGGPGGRAPARGLRVHGDRVEARLERETPADDPRWERLRRAALASAAPPPLFGGGGAADGDAAERRPPRAGGSTPADGPLTLAERLVAGAPDREGARWRCILVNPWIRDGGASAPRAPGSGGAGSAAGALLRTLLGEGSARDRDRVAESDVRLETLESLVAHLPELGDRLTDPEAYAVGRAIGQLAERVAERGVAERPGGGEELPGDPVLTYLDEHLSRIAADPRYAPALERVETRAGRTRLAKLVFLLESVGGFRGRGRMPVHLVAPETLAGDALGGLAGFLHREWRAEDFRAGRRDARRVLEEELSDLLAYEPDGEEAYERRSPEVSHRAIPEDARRAVADFARSEADRMMDEAASGLLASLCSWSWKPAVRRWAERRALDALRSAF